jgi:glycosyltransferase involved in cell wall biosynthesis
LDLCHVEQVRQRSHVMRILSVSQSYFPYLRLGGQPTKVMAISRGLQALGNQVTVLTAELEPLSELRDPQFQPTPCQYGHCATVEGAEVVYLRSRLRRRVVTINPDVVTFCRTQLRNFDVVHIYGIYDFLGPVVAEYCRRYNVPYVLETMGMFKPFSRNILGKRAYHKTFGRRLIAGAARVIATSPLELQNLVDGGIPREHLVLRRNGVEPPVLPAVGRFRERLSIPPNARLVLFLARILPLKSPDMLLRAFASVRARDTEDEERPWWLVIAGPEEDPEYKRELVRLRDELAVTARVVLQGPIYGEEKWSAYRDATVFVLPSTSENFGNTVAEAIVCGTPVIVTDRCGIASFVTNEQRSAGFVIPHDQRALENALFRAGNDVCLYSQLRTGCELASHELGWAEPITTMQRLYEELRRTTHPAGSDAVLGC